VAHVTASIWYLTYSLLLSQFVIHTNKYETDRIEYRNLLDTSNAQKFKMRLYKLIVFK